MSILKKSLIGAVSLLLLLLTGALLAPALIDQDMLKQRIETAVLSETGQRPRIDGALRWRLLPTPRAELGATSLPADDGISGPRLRIERLRLDLAVMPLLSGRIAFTTVAIDGLRLSLAPTSGVAPPPIALGRSRLAPPALRPAFGPATPATPAPDGRPPGGVMLVSSESPGTGVPRPPFPPIERLLLRDAALQWHVPSTDAEIVLGVPVLSAGPLAPGVQGLVEADLRVAGRQPQLAGDLSLTATLAPAADLSSVRIAPLRITGEDFSIADLADLPLVLGAQLTWRPTSATLAIDDLDVELGALRLLGQGDIAPGQRGSRLAAQLAVPPLDLRRWLEAHLAGPVPGTTRTLRSVAGQGLIELEDGQLALGKLRISVDDSNAAGAARLVLNPGTLPTGVAAVTLDQLDLDDYLAAPMQPTPEAPAMASPDQPDRADPPLPEPVGGLLVVRMDADSIRAGELLYRDATVVARLDADGWTADIEAADFYGGGLDARATGRRASGPAAPMPLTLSATAEDFDVGALLDETTVDAQISGRGRVELELFASAGSPAMIRESLGGTLAVAIEEGAFTGLDLSMLGTAVGRDASGASGQQASLMDFATLTASARGEKGLFRSDDIRARSPLVHIDGRGAVDVVAETLALDLEAVLVEPPSGAGLRELEGVPIPIDVSGPWHHPQWQVDVGPALRQAARQALDEKLREENGVLQQLEERTGIPLREGLERGLRGLFGQ